MDGLTTIVLVVFGVLQIILFFKLWGMTNDVEKLAGNMVGVARNMNKLVKHICKDDLNVKAPQITDNQGAISEEKAPQVETYAKIESQEVSSGEKEPQTGTHVKTSTKDIVIGGVIGGVFILIVVFFEFFNDLFGN